MEVPAFVALMDLERDLVIAVFCQQVSFQTMGRTIIVAEQVGLSHC